MNVCLLLSVTVTLLSQLVTCADPQDVRTVTAGSSAFSQRLYGTLSQSTLVYSPYSIHSALTMASYGASGDTAAEMSQMLGLGSLSGSAPHLAYRDLITQLNSASDVALHTANAIYVNPNYPIDNNFVSEVTTDYMATADNFDLAAPGGPEKAINDFVAGRTENQIQDLLPAGTIDSTTFMVLINTIFFNGSWDNPFEPTMTRSEAFRVKDGTFLLVPMMRDTHRHLNIKSDNNIGVDVVELPFKNKRFSLYIALPQDRNGISNLENFLAASPGNVDQLFTGLTDDVVNITIPKFKVETSLDLNTNLKSLGMVKAFDRDMADFSGISNVGIYISKVAHKAVMEVMEKGTVASAATQVTFVLKELFLGPIRTFRADHPFLFFLRDNDNNHILFQGKFSG